MFTQPPRGILRAVILVVGIALPATAGAQVLDTLVEWQRLTQVTVAGTATPTVFFTRPYAMTSIAMFDALNSIERGYQPYLIEVSASATASREAAIAQAAHDVLVALYPGQLATLDAALATTLSGRPAAAVAEGVQIGAAVARAVLQSRANDGWDRPVTPYLLPSLPGYYQVTPPQNATVTFTHYPGVQPFVIDRNRMLVAAPPALTSALYTQDFNEVKAIGGAISSSADGGADVDRAALGRDRNLDAVSARLGQHPARPRATHQPKRARCGQGLRPARHDDARWPAGKLQWQISLRAVASGHGDSRSGA